LSSLDNFLKSGEITLEEKERFEGWITKVLSDPAQVSSIVEEALKKGMFSEWEEESINHKFKLGSYYPSIIERCLRQQAYSYLYAVPPSPEELAIFNEGKAIHELVAFALRRSGLISVEGREVVINLEFEDAKLHGRIDDLLLIRLSETDENFRLFVPLEIKSTSSMPDQPKRSHYYQLMTYLLAENYPLGVLLYWAKREGKVKAFTITKDEDMRRVLRERVVELHGALKGDTLPRKEASLSKDYSQCERCMYLERCNPFLLEEVPAGSKLSLFDLDGTILDSYQRKKAILQDLGLPSSAKQTDIHDEEMKQKYWELMDDPKYVSLDALFDGARERVFAEAKLGRVPVAISSGRREVLLEATRARLANLGVPLFHLILREPGNFDTDGRFKTRWANRLAANYDLVEFFDRDAVTSSTIMKSIVEKKRTS
jgi:CRISPR/Cas system-associated exonuclease Cas4 (RecB family)/FMN phosphatase YigB (HAD superfamily)